MRHTGFSFILLITLIAACSEPEDIQSDSTFDEIYQQFYGKYEIVSSISERPVDLDSDGEASIDLIDEMPNIDNSHLVIFIKDNGINDENVLLFIHGWHEQVFSRSSSPDKANEIPSYVLKVVSSRFILNDHKDILFLQDDPNEFPLPEEVSVNDEGQIQTVISRKLFTPDGWQTVKITSTYSRYTTVT
jgi:hypothetical protein